MKESDTVIKMMPLNGILKIPLPHGLKNFQTPRGLGQELIFSILE